MGDNKQKIEKEMEEFDYSTLFDAVTPPDYIEQVVDEREAEYQKSSFDKRWAATFEEAKQKLAQQYTDAKQQLNEAQNKKYKDNKGKVFVGDELSGKTVSIGGINERRRQNAISNANSDMKQAIADMKLIGLTQEEIEQITKEGN